MPGVKRVFDIVFRVSTAEGAVKLLKSDKPALGISVNARGAVTIKAVQLVVGVVIVQGAGDILCTRLLGERAACNVHNGRAFAAFGIVAGVFLAPVAFAENVVALRVSRRVTIVGKKAGVRQHRGNIRRAVLFGLVVLCSGALVSRCGELHCGVSFSVIGGNLARPQLAVGGIGVGDFVHCHGFDNAAV